MPSGVHAPRDVSFFLNKNVTLILAAKGRDREIGRYRAGNYWSKYVF